MASKADPAADKAISQGVQPGVQKVQQQAGPQAQKFTDEQMMPAAQKVLPQRLAGAHNDFTCCTCRGVRLTFCVCGVLVGPHLPVAEQACLMTWPCQPELPGLQASPDA